MSSCCMIWRIKYRNDKEEKREKRKKVAFCPIKKGTRTVNFFVLLSLDGTKTKEWQKEIFHVYKSGPCNCQFFSLATYTLIFVRAKLAQDAWCSEWKWNAAKYHKQQVQIRLRWLSVATSSFCCTFCHGIFFFFFVAQCLYIGFQWFLCFFFQMYCLV